MENERGDGGPSVRSLTLIDRARVFRVCDRQFSDGFENLLPRREACLVTGLVQFGTSEDGHMNRVVPVRQKENAGCILGHVGFG
jgi:hypothetical protein